MSSRSPDTRLNQESDTLFIDDSEVGRVLWEFLRQHRIQEYDRVIHFDESLELDNRDQHLPLFVAEHT